MPKLTEYDFTFIPDVEAAWLAGYLDGDGSITLRSRGTFRQPMIAIDSTDLELLNRVEEIVGEGHTAKIAKKKAKENHRQTYTLRIIGGDRILALLRRVEPFMHCPVKKARSRLLIDRYKAVTPRNGYYTDETAKAKLEFEAEFLNIGAGRGGQIGNRGKQWKVRKEGYQRGNPPGLVR